MQKELSMAQAQAPHVEHQKCECSQF